MSQNVLFVDGYKRMAGAGTYTFLAINGKRLNIRWVVFVSRQAVSSSVRQQVRNPRQYGQDPQKCRAG
jgi:prophage maintenance system killer protein